MSFVLCAKTHPWKVNLPNRCYWGRSLEFVVKRAGYLGERKTERNVFFCFSSLASHMSCTQNSNQHPHVDSVPPQFVKNETIALRHSLSSCGKIYLFSIPANSWHCAWTPQPKLEILDRARTDQFHTLYSQCWTTRSVSINTKMEFNLHSK